MKSAVAATNNYGVETNWYTDTAAKRITSQENWTSSPPRPCTRGTNKFIQPMEKVWTSSIGLAVINTPTRDLHHNNVHHVPTIAKNLVCIHKFTADNKASLEYFAHPLLIKDLQTRRVLLEGRCKDGLYPIPTS